MIYADRGASGFLMATPDARWNSTDLACLQKLTLSNFEPVNVGAKAVTKPLVVKGVTYNVPATYQTTP